MLQLEKLTQITKKTKRKGRGGDRGGTSGRGNKGQRARTGGTHELGHLFEGGQMPLSRRIPRRGFSNREFKKEYVVLNLEVLEEKFNAGDEVTLQALKDLRLVKGNKGFFVKILGNGSLTKKLTVNADAFSQSAIEAIEKAGGEAILMKEYGSGGTTA